MVSGGKVNGDGETVFVCARRRAYGEPACDTGMHVKAADLERAVRDAVAQWAADIDAAARDRAQQAARDSAEAAVARLETQDGELRGRLRRLALERVADAEAGGILGDDAWAEDAWAEAALALRAEHTRVLADLERARAAAAAGPTADTSALLPDLLAQWDIPPANALNAILRTVVRRVAAYREAPGGRGRPVDPGGEPVRGAARLGGRPLGREMPRRGQRISGLPAPPGSGRPGYVHRAAPQHRPPCRRLLLHGDARRNEHYRSMKCSRRSRRDRPLLPDASVLDVSM